MNCSYPTVCAVVISLLALPKQVASQQADVGAAAWLAGCWVARAGSTTIEETWMAPSQEIMLGMSRTTREGRVTGHEFLLLRDREGTLVYTANPSGQSIADFTAVSVSHDLLRFENPGHDFPRRIDYARVSADSLLASVYGDLQSPDPAFTIRYGRARCPDGTEQ